MNTFTILHQNAFTNLQKNAFGFDPPGAFEQHLKKTAIVANGGEGASLKDLVSQGITLSKGDMVGEPVKYSKNHLPERNILGN